MPATAARLVEIAGQLEAEREFTLAAVVLEDAARRFPDDATVLVSLTNVLWVSHRAEHALEVCLRAEKLAPDDLGMHYNIAMIAAWNGRFDLASRSLERLAAVAPTDASLHYRLAESLDRQGRFQPAREHYERAVALQPDEPVYHIHLGYALLRLGDWARGWDEMAWYWRPEGLRRFAPWWRDVPCRMLAKGEPIAGKSIVVAGWGGAGDDVMFFRVAAKLAEQGASRVTVHLLRETSFYERNRWGFEVVGVQGDEARELYARHDAWISAPEVPAILGWQPADPVCEEPQFLPDPARQAAWRARLAGVGDRRLRVGIAWSGNPTNLYEHHRSISAQTFAPLLATPGIEWFVVQKNARNEELRALGHPHVHDLTADCSNLAELAALCSQLDLVISVDSLPAHLAASISLPTWLLLCAAGDWRWGLEGESTPWYGSMKIFRQHTLGDWAEVLGRVAAELAGMSHAQQG